MDLLEEPKSTVYSILSNIDFDDLAVQVTLGRPDVITVFPSITFTVSNNVPRYSLEVDILAQDIEIYVDIWAKKSTEAGSILKSVEMAMRNSGYLMTDCRDLDDETGIFHISTIFTF